LVRRHAAAPRADSLGESLDLGERRFARAGLTHLDRPRYRLQSKLKKSVGQFEGPAELHAHPQRAQVLFDSANINNRWQFARSQSGLRRRANALLTRSPHSFPEQGNSGDFTVQLGAGPELDLTRRERQPGIPHELNRMEWLREMAWETASRKAPPIRREVEYELASW